MPTPDRIRPARILARAASLAVLLAAALSAGACAESCCPPEVEFAALPGCLEQGGQLALAVGARANQPAPVLPGEVQTLLQRAAYDGNRISVFRVDGDPKPAGDATFSTNAQNNLRWRKDLENFQRNVTQAIGAVKAEKPEANPLEALARASEAAGGDGTVVLLDSGLQTLPPLDFRQDGMLDADPVELVDFLEKEGQLPHLEGRAMVLVGIGTTAEPQQSLDTSRRDNLLEIWREIGKRAGARCVEAFATSQQAPAAAGLPAVGAVAVPPPPNPPTSCTTVSLRDAGRVKFRPNTAEFLDEQEAAAELKTYADTVTAKKYQVKLTGTTSSAGENRNTDNKRQLSLDRAEAVKRILVGHGVAASDIETFGVGMDFTGFVKDRDGDGALVPQLAARNRQVILELTGCR
ncbi:OmpA family protein [Catellatospora sp. NPDC049609]|uniref:OmpA family protein n=1 Tax=Catellatospora sp. NPDC049609 TaxID=3155505 RepID=UPI003422A7BF